jgi:uncharacterized protein (DUF1330 family)
MRFIDTSLLTLGMLACVASATAAHAQDKATPPAPAYYVADFKVEDREAIKPYSAGVEATFKPFGGRFIVRGADPVALEGDAPKGRLVVIEFDSMEKAQAWYHSPAYTQLRPIRQKAGLSNIYILQGLSKQMQQ